MTKLLSNEYDANISNIKLNMLIFRIIYVTIIISSFVAIVLAQNVEIYQHSNYGGAYKVIYGDMPWLGNDFNDIVSSLRVPSGDQVTLFENFKYGGRSKTFTSDTPYVGDDFNDIASSIKVTTPSPSSICSGTGAGRACLCDGPGREGACNCLNYGCEYPSLGWFNDITSSLQLDPGIGVKLYTDENYRGRSKTFTSNLLLNTYVGDDFDNAASSAEVFLLPALYEHYNYEGRAVTISGDNPHLDLNDVISSLRVPPGYSVTLFENYNYGGRSKTFTSDTSNVGDDFNDIASSVRVYYNPIGYGCWGQNAAKLFEDFNFGGRSYPLAYYGPSQTACQHDYYTLSYFNNIVSSIKFVNPGFGVILYADENYGGGSRIFTSDVPNIGDFNDIAKSAKVVRLPSLYEHYNYEGRAVTISGDNPHLDLNDIISSLRVPPGYSVTLFENYNYGGRSKTFTSDTSNVGDDFNDIASSVKINIAFSSPDIQKDLPVLFHDFNYKGNSIIIRNDIPDLKALNFDKITSSLQVPKGLYVILYEQVNYGGEGKIFDKDTTNVGVFNDKASSIKIFIGTPPSPANLKFSPLSGKVGDAVTISGDNFIEVKQVQFGNANSLAAFNVKDSQTIIATVPANAVTGTITVITSSGSATSSAKFTVMQTPPQPTEKQYLFTLNKLTDSSGTPILGPNGVILVHTGPINAQYIGIPNQAKITGYEISTTQFGVGLITLAFLDANGKLTGKSLANADGRKKPSDLSLPDSASAADIIAIPFGAPGGMPPTPPLYQALRVYYLG